MNNKKVLFSLIVGLMFCFLTGCSKATDGDDNGTSNNSGGDVRKEATGKFGKYEGAYFVGDIVFKDGSATPYSNTLTLTAEQKAAAIAIIFYKGTTMNNPGVNKTRTLGYGIYQSPGAIDWCTNEANAKNIKIWNTLVHSNFNLTESINDGSNNFSRIGEYLVNPDPYQYEPKEDDTGNPDLYPAFYFAKNYKTYAASHVEGTSFENGWYLPSLSELREIWLKFSVVEPANTLCGGTAFRMEPEEGTDRYPFYWSSSASDDCKDWEAASFSFELESASAHNKSLSTSQFYTTPLYALVIREF